ncbi:MAG: hypothetical protein U0R69_04585 [Gaiellales bacterium]
MRATVIAVMAAALALAGNASAADPAAEKLVAKYAPIVRLVEQEGACGIGEPFEPIDVELVLGSDEVAFRGPWNRTDLVGIGPTADELGRGKPGYHLDFPGNPVDPGCTYEEWSKRISKGSTPTTYGRVVKEAGYPDKLALQYWFFYVFNDYNNKHEGDWEMIQLVFDAADAAGALLEDPVLVGYSQHEGGERAEWGEEKLEVVGGTHVVVYPGAGSHANHFGQGLYLGRSAEQGVGCDDTNGPHRELEPVARTVPTDPVDYLLAYPWLGFLGRWGELQPAFFNGPTGPNDKLQWTQPISWSEAWRDTAFRVPVGRALGPDATDFFCSAIARGSAVLTRAINDPAAVLIGFAVVVGLLVFAASRTAWESSAPLRLARRRAWGQIVSSARRMYRSRFGLFARIGLAFVPAGILIALLQALLFRLVGLDDLTESVGERNALTTGLALGLGLLFELLALTIVQAATARAMVEIDAGRPVTALTAYASLRGRVRHLLGALIFVAALSAVLLSVTLFLALPIVVWLVTRWSLLSQVIVLERRSAFDSLSRSAELVRGRFWRVATITLVVVGIALLLGPLLGVALLFVTSASFDVVNLVSSFVYVITIPFAAIATTYLYFDCRVREQIEPEERRRVAELPAEI